MVESHGNFVFMAKNKCPHENNFIRSLCTFAFILSLFPFQQYSHPDQATVKAVFNTFGEAPNLKSQIRDAVREVLVRDFNLTSGHEGHHGHGDPYGHEGHFRHGKQYDHFHKGGFGPPLPEEEIPLHEPTGEKTRKTYDFTRAYTFPI